MTRFTAALAVLALTAAPAAAHPLTMKQAKAAAVHYWTTPGNSNITASHCQRIGARTIRCLTTWDDTTTISVNGLPTVAHSRFPVTVRRTHGRLRCESSMTVAEWCG